MEARRERRRKPERADEHRTNIQGIFGHHPRTSERAAPPAGGMAASERENSPRDCYRGTGAESRSGFIEDFEKLIDIYHHFS